MKEANGKTSIITYCTVNGTFKRGKLLGICKHIKVGDDGICTSTKECCYKTEKSHSFITK